MMDKVITYHFDTGPALRDLQPLAWYDSEDDCIYLSDKLTQVEREIVYAHEDQHRKCYHEKCFCWGMDSDFWKEYHAMKAEFEFALEKGGRYLKAYRKLFVDCLKRYKKNPESKAYLQASLKLMRLKAFRENVL